MRAGGGGHLPGSIRQLRGSQSILGGLGRDTRCAAGASGVPTNRPRRVTTADGLVPLRWGIVGLGQMASRFARSLEASPASELHAVAARSVERARTFASAHQCRAHESYADVLLDPEGTLLGAKQRDWLFSGLERSPATWNVLAQQVMMARVDRAAGPAVEVSMDQWSGYEFERRRLLTRGAQCQRVSFVFAELVFGSRFGVRAGGPSDGQQRPELETFAHSQVRQQHCHGQKNASRYQRVGQEP